MDVLLGELSEGERRDPIWLKVETYLRDRHAQQIRKLINSEEDNEQTRGRIKELEYLLKPPAEPHTAQ